LPATREIPENTMTDTPLLLNPAPLPPAEPSPPPPPAPREPLLPRGALGD